MEWEPELVVALDIGTTYSGYAWQWRSDFENNRSNVEFNTTWGVGALQFHKTNTCILLDKDGKLDSIGYLAEMEFTNICDEADGPPTDWLFFKEFKHRLKLEGSTNENFEIEDYYGRHMSFLDVMTQFVCGLKEHFTKKLTAGHTLDMEKIKIRWVITVPAIWSEEAKQFMRKAAENSGINRKNVLIALEPESAALYGMGLSEDQRKHMNDFGRRGDKFVVADLGGGTVDILAIEVMQDGSLKHIGPGDGAMVGGQAINDCFFQVCKDSFEGNVWDEVFTPTKNMEKLLELETSFEKSKCAIGSAETNVEYIKVNIPHDLSDMIKEGKTILKSSVDFKHFKIQVPFVLKRDGFKFKSEFVKKILFGETVDQAVSQVEKTLADLAEAKKLKHVRTLVLVGGFAESKIVREKFEEMIRKKYPNMKVVVPSSPFRAVLHGAVLFGHDPHVFRSRISRATYGVEYHDIFKKGVHDPRKKLRYKGKEYCMNLFDAHVRKGESVVFNETLPTKTYIPMDATDTVVHIPVYECTGDEVPKYTTDTGCKLFMTVIVETPDTKDGRNRKLTVSFVYGGTELSVIVIDQNTGKEINAKLHF